MWNYRQFAATGDSAQHQDAKTIELVFDSKFQGHGNEELWRINGLGYPSDLDTSQLTHSANRTEIPSGHEEHSYVSPLAKLRHALLFANALRYDLCARSVRADVTRLK